MTRDANASRYLSDGHRPVKVKFPNQAEREQIMADKKMGMTEWETLHTWLFPSTSPTLSQVRDVREGRI